MDANSLKILLKNNVGMLFESENYSDYIKQTISVEGYDFMNRFLIFFQNRRATDVKGELAWSELGRAVIESNKPIWVIVPVYRSVYINIETEAELKNNELSLTEIIQALELGLIQRQKSIVDFESTMVYDIGDTRIINEAQAEEYETYSKKKNIKLSTLCDLCKQTCDMQIASNDGDTYYSSEYNTIYIGKDSGVNKASAIVKILVGCLIERLTNNYELYTGELDSMASENKLVLDDINRRFIEDSVMYAVYNYMGINVEYAFEYIKEVYQEVVESERNMTELINKLNCIEYLTDSILSKFNSGNIDSTSKILVMKKAERLLDIIEANNVMLLLRGGIAK